MRLDGGCRNNERDRMAKELPTLGELEIRALRLVWEHQPCTERQISDIILAERDVLRFTPSGIPLIDCVLPHHSELIEAGQLRQVEVEAPAIGFESVAHRLAACELHKSYRFIGFPANRTRKSKRAVSHAIRFHSHVKTH